jgi:DNA polymerase III alpha subunit
VGQRLLQAAADEFAGVHPSADAAARALLLVGARRLFGLQRQTGKHPAGVFGAQGGQRRLT